ncbi:TPA: hypothetical protein ACIYQG_004363 [Escherichia coli]
MNQESRLPPGSDFRRWVWITIAPFVTGHEKYESTEVNLRFFALDVAASYQVQFTLDTTNAL